MDTEVKLNKRKIVIVCAIFILIAILFICIKQCETSEGKENMNIESDIDIKAIGFTLIDSKINEFDYSNGTINLGIIGIEDYDVSEILYCVSSDSKCSPTEKLEEEIIVFDEEKTNIKTCIQVVFEDDSKSEVICSNPYNIDKTKPAQGKIVLDGVIGNNNWYTSSINVNVEDGYDELSGLEMTTVNKQTITEDTSEETIILTSRDKAGNVVEDYITVKKDATAPIIHGVLDKNYEVGDEADLYEGISCTDNLSSKDKCVVNANISKIDTGKAAVYKVIYSAEDEAGNITNKTATIKIDAAEPTINLLVDDSKINENGWANENLSLSVNIKDYSNTGIKETLYCISNKKCEPTEKLLDEKILITNEGENVICVTSSDNNKKSASKCSEIYKIDKTAPTAGEIIVSSVNTITNGWYKNNVALSVVNGSDALSGHQSTTVDITTITEDTKGETVTLTTIDLAGNSSLKTLTIKIDKTVPTLEAKSSEVVKITEGDDVNVKDYFTSPTYGISGEGSFTCDVVDTTKLTVGFYDITCSATSKSGLRVTAVKQLEVASAGVNTISKITGLEGTTQGEGVVIEDKGIRYQGKNPNNYIIFNNETWRILGVFDTTLADGTTTEYLVKIIKESSIGSYSWDNTRSIIWSDSQINQLLNNYYINSTSSTSSIASCDRSTCDFTSIGISSEYRNMIADVTWYTGQVETAIATANDIYTQERNASGATGKLGLMYASDYGFSVKETDCARTKTLYDYDSSTCYNNNWLFENTPEWTMISNKTTSVIDVKTSGYVGSTSPTFPHIIRPVLYLKSDVLISDATGSIIDPYIVIK